MSLPSSSLGPSTSHCTYVHALGDIDLVTEEPSATFSGMGFRPVAALVSFGGSRQWPAFGSRTCEKKEKKKEKCLDTTLRRHAENVLEWS